MGRHCCFPGCKNTSGLHSFPADLEMRRQWLRALGLPDRDLPPRAGVCNRHFSRDCFSNLMEVDMGFTKVLMLKRNAVPNVALPVTTKGPPLHLKPKLTREIGCQTEPVSTKHAAGQANMKPNRRSKGTFVAVPEPLANPEVPRESSTPVKRTKCEVSTDDSSYKLDVTDSTMNCTSTSNELPPHTVTKYLVHEDMLMELFQRCPICTRSCLISKTVTGTILQVEQSCTFCEYFHQWSSQPMVKNIPAGNLELCPAVLFTGSSFVKVEIT
ncbi:uncharacterized protein LOC122888330 isoform X2 [Siniperca chuatsi]|uniref:uncharacterized protein LOC122888330 isoform X2 n=1 Tax=Siniperca chuatsi TaxID=119488 RepID=UPI001CE1BAD3|nr:uncharacterized protein LOC122888330 isoform X2 [Siniperca chuatsi]